MSLTMIFFLWYYWIAFFATLYFFSHRPHVLATIWATIGFIIWPIALAVYIRNKQPHVAPVYFCRKCGYFGDSERHDGCGYSAIKYPPDHE